MSSPPDRSVPPHALILVTSTLYTYSCSGDGAYIGSTRCRSHQVSYANSMPAGPVLTSKRTTTQTSVPNTMFRSPPAAISPRTSQLSNPTESSNMKAHKGPPNQSDKGTGWGPIENMTVATLEYVHNKQHTPREDQAFMELATWLSSHAQPRPGLITADVSGDESLSNANSPDRGQQAEPADTDMAYYTRLAEQLLTLHKSTLAALIQEPPKHDMTAYWARQLWNSIPQPDGRPAVWRHHCCRAPHCLCMVQKMGYRIQACTSAL